MTRQARPVANKTDAVKGGAILRCSFNFRAVLFIDLRADERRGFFQFLHALFERGALGRGGGGCFVGRGRRGAFGARLVRCRRLEQSARAQEVFAQLLHFRARLRIFGAHLIHERAELANLILQLADGGGSVCRSGRCAGGLRRRLADCTN